MTFNSVKSRSPLRRDSHQESLSPTTSNPTLFMKPISPMANHTLAESKPAPAAEKVRPIDRQSSPTFTHHSSPAGSTDLQNIQSNDANMSFCSAPTTLPFQAINDISHYDSQLNDQLEAFSMAHSQHSQHFNPQAASGQQDWASFKPEFDFGVNPQMGTVDPHTLSMDMSSITAPWMIPTQPNGDPVGESMSAISESSFWQHSPTSPQKRTFDEEFADMARFNGRSSRSTSPPKKQRRKRGEAKLENPDDHREEQRAKNREAAKKCRDRKKGQVDVLQHKAKELEAEQMWHKHERDQLLKQVQYLKNLACAHVDCSCEPIRRHMIGGLDVSRVRDAVAWQQSPRTSTTSGSRSSTSESDLILGSPGHDSCIGSQRSSTKDEESPPESF